MIYIYLYENIISVQSISDFQFSYDLGNFNEEIVSEMNVLTVFRINLDTSVNTQAVECGSNYSRPSRWSGAEF